MLTSPCRRAVCAAVALLVVKSRALAFQPTRAANRVLLVGSNDIATSRTHVTAKFKTRRFPSSNGQRAVSTALNATPAEVAAVGAAAAAGLPTLNAVALSCLLPSLLGYYKSEYGVSYAYGTAMATVAFLVLRTLPSASVLPYPATIAACHASAVFFYGVRLNLFLAYREMFVPRFRKMRERIEDRAKKRGSRLSRTPFILFCAGLYGCMTAPLLVTGKLCRDMPLYTPGGGWAKIATLVASNFAWFGFLLGALGDLTKSVVKANKGEDYLVTEGVFTFFRHPNYTGEVIGWTANCAAAFFAIQAAGGGLAMWKTYAPYLVASVLGAMLISFVLGAATVNLESRQRDEYGKMQKYKDWVKTSWVGFKFGKKKKDGNEDTDDEMPDFELDESEGSGI